MTKKPNSATERDKLSEEIKSLRLQRVLLILTTLGSLGVFVIRDFANIQMFLYPPPALKVISADPFVQENASLSVSRLEDGKWHQIVKTRVSEGEDWIKLSEGSFAISVQLNGESFFSSEIQLQNGDHRVILVDKSISGPMRIAVNNNTPKPRPKAPIMLDIKSSGRGYLWLFDVTPDQKLALIYPPPLSLETSHEILPEVAYQLPDKNGFGVFAGEHEGLERIAAVVTATPDQAKALGIAGQFTKAAKIKASGGQVTVDWGAVVESYYVVDDSSTPK